MGARILITGKNRDFPKTVAMPLGVGVDGSIITGRIQIAAHEEKCPRCAGWGSYEVWDGNPSHRDETVGCDVCNGDGIISHEVM